MAEYTLNELTDMHLLYGDTCSTASLRRKVSDEKVTISQLLVWLVPRVQFRAYGHQFVETEHQMIISSSKTFLRKVAVRHVSLHTEDAYPYAEAREWLVNANTQQHKQNHSYQDLSRFKQFLNGLRDVIVVKERLDYISITYWRELNPMDQKEQVCE
ncbi:hypothetical protein L9F63_022068, partial [Diploptera punctata]